MKEVVPDEVEATEQGAPVTVAVGIAYSVKHEMNGVQIYLGERGIWMSKERARLYGEMLLQCAEALEEDERFDCEEE